ncbi:MAG: hypothetical protein R3D86_00600 [Emcibacteraceae bacterium]
MNEHKSLKLTRRGFNAGLGAVSLSAGLPLRALAEQEGPDMADALLQLRGDGKLVIYSGAGHLGPYGTENIIDQLTALSGKKSGDIIFALCGNPEQLPAVLGQYSHHMSFTSVKTIKNAVKLLLQALPENKTDQKSTRYIIDEGVCPATLEMMKRLEPDGIIVAARQVSV